MRYILSILFIAAVIAASASLYFPSYWVHRYDELIDRQAHIYRLDERLVWSLIYEETFFRAWKVGAAGEIGLMQVTPAVAREWSKGTGLKDLERQAADDVNTLLVDPERNIQVGCWYLEKLREQYRGSPSETAMMLAAYNAGPSRVQEWLRDTDPAALTEGEFISRINITTTRQYVTSILERYRSREKKPGAA